jgi:hypothetical protein
MERGGTRLRAGPAAPPLPLPLPLLDDQHDEAAAALADARRRLEELLLQTAVVRDTCVFVALLLRLPLSVLKPTRHY